MLSCHLVLLVGSPPHPEGSCCLCSWREAAGAWPTRSCRGGAGDRGSCVLSQLFSFPGVSVHQTGAHQGGLSSEAALLMRGHRLPYSRGTGLLAEASSTHCRLSVLSFREGSRESPSPGPGIFQSGGRSGVGRACGHPTPALVIQIALGQAAARLVPLWNSLGACGLPPRRVRRALLPWPSTNPALLVPERSVSVLRPRTADQQELVRAQLGTQSRDFIPTTKFLHSTASWDTPSLC